MAEYGLEAYNNNDQLLLNNDNDFFRFQETGTSSDPYGNYIPKVDITFDEPIPKGEPILVGVRCNETGTGMVFFNEDGSGNLSGITILIDYFDSPKVDYILFVRYGWNPSPDTSASWGLQLFDGNGGLLYDSRVAELQVIDQIAISDSSGDSASHVSRDGAFYDIASLDHYVEQLEEPSPTGGSQVYAFWNVYKQTTSTTLECKRRRAPIPVDQPGPTTRNTSDGKTVLVDDNLYY